MSSLSTERTEKKPPTCRKWETQPDKTDSDNNKFSVWFSDQTILTLEIAISKSLAEQYRQFITTFRTRSVIKQQKNENNTHTHSLRILFQVLAMQITLSHLQNTHIKMLQFNRMQKKFKHFLIQNIDKKKKQWKIPPNKNRIRNIWHTNESPHKINVAVLCMDFIFSILFFVRFVWWWRWLSKWSSNRRPNQLTFGPKKKERERECERVWKNVFYRGERYARSDLTPTEIFPMLNAIDFQHTRFFVPFFKMQFTKEKKWFKICSPFDDHTYQFQ